jgi:hypothetical protein
MTRHNKKATSIDSQRGEGAAERERMLRSVPIEEPAPIPSTPAVVEPTMPRANGNVANVFRTTDKPGIQAVDELPQIEGYKVYGGQNIDVASQAAAAINDILGGSEEASAMISFDI